MKQEKKIPLTDIVERFRKATKYDFQMNHLAVLVHGWRKKHPDQAPSVSALFERKKTDGFAWLSSSEAAFLGAYAGYPITKNQDS